MKAEHAMRPERNKQEPLATRAMRTRPPDYHQEDHAQTRTTLKRRQAAAQEHLEDFRKGTQQ